MLNKQNCSSLSTGLVCLKCRCLLAHERQDQFRCDFTMRLYYILVHLCSAPQGAIEVWIRRGCKKKHLRGSGCGRNTYDKAPWDCFDFADWQMFKDAFCKDSEITSQPKNVGKKRRELRAQSKAQRFTLGWQWCIRPRGRGPNTNSRGWGKLQGSNILCYLKLPACVRPRWHVGWAHFMLTLNYTEINGKVHWVSGERAAIHMHGSDLREKQKACGWWNWVKLWTWWCHWLSTENLTAAGSTQPTRLMSFLFGPATCASPII